jgi:hypothetical protein
MVGDHAVDDAVLVIAGSAHRLRKRATLAEPKQLSQAFTRLEDLAVVR